MGGLLSGTGSVLRRTAAPLCAAALALAVTAATAAAGGRTASRVLITGGQIDGAAPATASAEVWDSSTGTFTATGSMIQPRKFHTASLLTSGTNAGLVLIAGGQDDTNTPVSNAELYSPALGSFSGPIAMNIARAYHTATVLNDGRVLIAGGTSGTGSGETILQSAEIYDPTAGSFTLITCTVGNVPSNDCMTAARSSHTATLLGSGQVLIAGGATTTSGGATNTAEIFDPTSDTFTPISSSTMVEPRENHAAILLNDGTVLIAGGNNGTFQQGVVTADVFDPSTSTFIPVNSSLSVARVGMTAAILGGGKAMMTGGASSTVADLFTDRTDLFAPARGFMNDARWYGTATTLKNGTVLLAGGGNNTAEIANARASSFTLTGSMSVSRENHTATLLP